MKKAQFELKDNSNKSQIDKFRQMHPKATKDLSDDEVAQLGNAISDIQDDDTKRTFKDVFTDESGQRFVIVDDDGEDIAIPLLKSGSK